MLDKTRDFADGVPRAGCGDRIGMAETEESEERFLAELGQRVRNMRAVHGMSRKTLSKVSGLSERYIAQLESGHGNVSIILLRRVAMAIGTKLQDLLPSADVSPDWPLIRDRLREASSEQLDRIKSILSDDGQGAAPAPLRVALIGLRGAGKSTLGRMAAERLGWPFVELNREIERENGLSVPEIFALYGQEGYRRMEQDALRKLTLRTGPMVLATGGGIVAEPLTFDLVLSSFFTIWLKARPDEHMGRVRQQGDLRPMGNDRFAMDELRAILASREPLYARARAVLDTSGAKLEASAEELTDLINAQVERSVAPRRTAARR
ncbi:shikimate kinase [Chelatococcus reniformis]|uniref:Shikimate kinase n=2 Tax=Chelatococcus reniformis TaxID=1494448 RepID=A0A916X756_9HYPH|nr:shikimate kinase [Chelatococcus reniformis]